MKTRISVPKPRKLASGNYTLQIMLNGERISVTRPTAESCISYAMELKTAHRGEKQPQMKKAILHDLMRNYIDKKEPILSPSTVEGMESVLRCRFLNYQDQDVRKIDFQQMINDEFQLVGAKTIKNAWSLVTSSLKLAKMDVPTVSLPRIPRNEHPFLDQEEITFFLSLIRGTSIETACLLGLHSLRRSEIFALKREDIDLKRKTIHVRRSALKDKNRNIIISNLNKTDKSNRVIPIFIPRLVELLVTSENPIVTFDNDLMKKINKLCRQNGLPEIGVHGLRHSFASLCYSLGVDERSCMRLGGWSDVGTVNKIYTHISERSLKASETKLIDFFR